MKIIKKFLKYYFSDNFIFLRKFFHRKSFFNKYRYQIFLYGTISLFLILLFFSLNNVSASRIDLLSLKEGIEFSSTCHEDCRRTRQQQKETIALNLKEDRRLVYDFKEYFLSAASNDDENSRFLWQELLQIVNLSSDVGVLLDFFIDYLIDNEANDVVKADIIRFLLTNINDIGLAEYYFMILNNESHDILKIEALRALSLLKPKELLFKEEQLDVLSVLILRNDLSPRLKMDSLFLLNDYRPFFPEKLKSVLLEIYHNSQEGPLQAMAANFLKELDETDYLLPETNESEWLPYF